MNHQKEVTYSLVLLQTVHIGIVVHRTISLVLYNTIQYKFDKFLFGISDFGRIIMLKMFYFTGGSVVIPVLLRYISWLRYKEFGHRVEVQHEARWQNAGHPCRHQGQRVHRESTAHFRCGRTRNNILDVKDEQLVWVELSDVLF